MPFELTPIDYAEIAIIAAGVMIILSVALHALRHNRLSEFLQLPKGPEHNLQPVDLLITGFAFTSMFIVAYKFWSIFFETPVTSQPASQPSESELVEPQKTLAAITGHVVNCVILSLIGWDRFRRNLANWGISFRSMPRQVYRAVICYIAIWPVCYGALYLAIFVHVWLYGDTPPEHTAIETLKGVETPIWIKTATIVSAVGLVPILEELFFRGLLLPALSKWLCSEWNAILLSGLIFGLVHIPLYHHIPALIIFGILLGYVYARTRSLTLVILIHAVFNAKTILWLFLMEGEKG
ncbi:MAG: CPBP family intramembrane metalloprotease [Phycisphaerales bacterium]|nr:CPBP family intramembrane metalloprotease [Phycisphaerales bacterium]